MTPWIQPKRVGAGSGCSPSSSFSELSPSSSCPQTVSSYTGGLQSAQISEDKQFQSLWALITNHRFILAQTQILPPQIKMHVKELISALRFYRNALSTLERVDFVTEIKNDTNQFDINRVFTFEVFYFSCQYYSFKLLFQVSKKIACCYYPLITQV